MENYQRYLFTIFEADSSDYLSIPKLQRYVWERISNFIPHFTGHVITYQLIHVSKMGPYCKKSLQW